MALGGAPDGKLYAVSSTGDLYTVSRENGTSSLVGATGVNVASYAQSMAWDSQTNSFLWSAVTPTGRSLYSLDPENGSATLIKKLSDNDQIVCIYPLDSGKAAGCPEAASVPEWSFSTPGADNGSISLTTPDSGKLWLYLDGTAAIDGTYVSAGQKVSVPFEDLDNRTHHVSAFVKNDSGWSPLSESFRYVGLDVPLPVTDLTFSEADGTILSTKRLGRNPQPLLCLSLLFEIGVEVGEPGVGAACAGVGGVGFVGVGFAFEGDVAVGAVGVTVLDQAQKPFQ